MTSQEGQGCRDQWSNPRATRQRSKIKRIFDNQTTAGERQSMGGQTLVASLNLLLGGINSRHSFPRRLTF